MHLERVFGERSAFPIGKRTRAIVSKQSPHKSGETRERKGELLAKSAGVELGTLQSLVDRAQSMTINAPADTDYEILADATLARPERSREPHYELNFAIRKISVYESV